MASMPSWIVVDSEGVEQTEHNGRAYVLRFHVRRWHPGLWLMLLRWAVGRPRSFRRDA